MIEVLLGFPEAASESKVSMCRTFIRLHTWIPHFEREGKGSRIGQRIRMMLPQPKPLITLWRALKLEWLFISFPITGRKLSILTLNQSVTGCRLNLRRYHDLRQNSWRKSWQLRTRSFSPEGRSRHHITVSTTGMLWKHPSWDRWRRNKWVFKCSPTHKGNFSY